MFALLLVTALTVLTITLASRLQVLADVLWLIGASLLGGIVLLAVHPELDWVAVPRADEGTCGAEDGIDAAPIVERISVDDARELLGEPIVTFVDARGGAAYGTAHIPGAMNLPAADAEGLLDMQSLPIPPEGQVIAYCDGGSCEQSEYLGLLLRQRAVCQQVRVLEGGWQAWVAAQAPVVHGFGRYGDAPVSESPANPEAAG